MQVFLRSVISWASLFIGTIGLLGNFTSIYILSKHSDGSRFCHLLIVLAYVDISYVTIDVLHVVLTLWDKYSPERGVLKLWLVFYPHLFHPCSMILQTAMVIITVILR